MESGPLSPFNGDAPVSFTVAAAPVAAYDVQLNLTAVSDLGVAAIVDEWIDVDINGVFLYRFEFPTSFDCAQVEGSAVIDGAAYNAAVALGGGTAVVTLTGGPLINDICGPNTFVDLEICASQPGPSSDCNKNIVPDECELTSETDCNANGVLDECELTTETDCDGNGVLDECELTSETDCNGNGIIDRCEIATSPTLDCNQNGVPDECELTTETDCNGNQVLDECELTSETDCDGNGVLDECELTSETDCDGNGVIDRCEIGPETDCDGNGVLDECELTSETDCNGNGVLDECEVASGASPDCNANGIPDDCEPDCNANGVPDDCDITTGVDLTLFSEDFESGLGSWTTSGLWRLAPNGDCLAVGDGEVLTTPTQAAYNLAADCNYNVGETSGVLELAGDIAIPANAVTASLKWYNFAETELGGNGDEIAVGQAPPDINGQLPPFDRWYVEVSSDGGTSWSIVFVGDGSLEGFWSELTADLTAYAGKSIKIRFVFDSVDGEANGYLGWYLDDIRVVASVRSIDCNLNGIPDECEPDCNGNGIADECDISSGTSEDCNLNGVPDECEPDCNGNGVADECDISSGTSQDCNQNGVPDECDITSGTSDDCNSNGIPDECEPDCNNNGVADECDLIQSGPVQLFGEDFESGLAQWTATGLWKLESDNDCVPAATLTSPTQAAYNTGSPDCNYDTGAATSGSLSMVADIAVPANLLWANLKWYNFANVEGLAPYDQWVVEISTDSGANWAVLYDGASADAPAWAELSADLSAYGGQSIRLRFTFDSVDRGFNLTPGWLIDDIRITAQAAATSNDCNNNGIPDECEPDCNENGVPDDCDITTGGLQDCNENGIPDECEVTSAGEDCNGNGVPDECDITSGTSTDCDENGVPDECDPDCNNNGIADGCDFFTPDPEVLLDEDFESGLGNWTATGLWRTAPDGECLVAATLTTPTQAAYNQASSCDYEVGGVTSGSLTMAADLAIPANLLWANLKWFNYANTEDDPGFDQWLVEVSTDGGANWAVLYDGQGADAPAWTELTADLSAYAGQNIRLRFFFDSVDRWLNDGLGWSVDDIRVTVQRASNSIDCNENGIPDECEPDCNANGVADECDIASSTSLDCNTNGVPDECEADCNGNGVPDDCDITTGTSADCNQNGVPDECDITSGTSQDCNSNGIPDECETNDCNGNGVPDECDIENGTSEDCNSNGIPDECDITSGSEDCNGNGIPDECDLVGSYDVQSPQLSPFDRVNPQTGPPRLRRTRPGW